VCLHASMNFAGQLRQTLVQGTGGGRTKGSQVTMLDDMLTC
jgi:hypothetical protein